MKISVVGGGPAGLMAAEVLAQSGHAVTVFDRMPSVGRKLLMAGRGGLNLTHVEELDAFLGRYGDARGWLEPVVRAFPPKALRDWAEGLGESLFVGSSGRVFPRKMKASPLLRAWLARLAGLGVDIRTRQRWTGWDGARGLVFEDGSVVESDAVVLALGGASWPRLGSDGSWTGLIEGVAPLKPANVGFKVKWSDMLRERFAGEPLKRIALRFGDQTVRGEAMITAAGIEGGAIYALSAPLRDAIAAQGEAVLKIDLRPDLDFATLAEKLAAPRRAMSLANFLRKIVALPPVAVTLLYEGGKPPEDARGLATLIKSVPLKLVGAQPIDRAISSAGGVMAEAVDGNCMLRARPGVFVAGEMLDWEAPTGGYLLQGCFATGVAAARGVLAWAASDTGGE